MGLLGEGLTQAPVVRLCVSGWSCLEVRMRLGVPQEAEGVPESVAIAANANERMPVVPWVGEMVRGGGELRPCF